MPCSASQECYLSPVLRTCAASRYMLMLRAVGLRVRNHAALSISICFLENPFGLKKPPKHSSTLPHFRHLLTKEVTHFAKRFLPLSFQPTHPSRCGRVGSVATLFCHFTRKRAKRQKKNATLLLVLEFSVELYLSTRTSINCLGVSSE